MIEITCKVRVKNDGSIVLVNDLGIDQDDSLIFGCDNPSTLSLAQALEILNNLPAWIMKRYRAKVDEEIVAAKEALRQKKKPDATT